MTDSKIELGPDPNIKTPMEGYDELVFLKNIIQN